MRAWAIRIQTEFDSPCPLTMREGDLIVVFQSGAYGLTASPTAFLGHPAPVEVLV